MIGPTSQVTELALAQGRLAVIASAHSKDVREHGLTSGLCWECDHLWPCPTYVWATSADRVPAMDTWDPADDEVTR